MKPYRLMLGAAAVVAALMVVPASALGAPTFDNNSGSQGGLCLGGEGLDDDLAEVACSESESTTSNEEAAGRSESTPLGVLETIEVNEKTCEAVGVPRSGRVTDDEDQTSQIENEEGTVGLFTSACEATAVQTNNSESSSETSLLFAEQEGTGSLVVFHSEAGQPEGSEDNEKTKTTRGNASSYAEFTGVEAESGENSLTVLHCTSSSRATQNNETTETESDFLDANGDEAEDLDPLAEALCPLFVSSEASKG
jgi:hypothetical protein